MVNSPIIRKIMAKKSPLVMVTAYDAPTAQLLERLGVDLILVGDSVANVVLGYNSTRAVTMDEMAHHSRAVLRSVKKTPVIVDLPWHAVKQGLSASMTAIEKFHRMGCHGVKIEWSKQSVALTKKATQRSIPIMGHVGLTPQSVSVREGFRVRGHNRREFDQILKQAHAFESAGAFSLVLECVPQALASRITQELSIPTIGIGAGKACDGQVLVFQDIVGANPAFKPKFLKRYGNTHKEQERAIKNFVKEVRMGKYPGKKHTYV